MLAPGGEPDRPVGLDPPVAFAGAGQRGEAARVPVVAVQIIGPGDALPPFGQCRAGKIRFLSGQDRFAAGGIVDLDQRQDLGRKLGRDGIVLDRVRTFAGRRRAEPDQPLLCRKRRRFDLELSGRSGLRDGARL